MIDRNVLASFAHASAYECAEETEAMRCVECGAQLNPNSQFCDQCGTPTRDVEETRIARNSAAVPARYSEDDDIEHVLFTARPTMLFIKIGYVAAIIGAILLTI